MEGNIILGMVIGGLVCTILYNFIDCIMLIFSITGDQYHRYISKDK